MTFLVFLMAVLAVILHAGWNFVATQAAGNAGALWLGVSSCAVLAHQAEPLTLASLPYHSAKGCAPVSATWCPSFVQ
jgi:hypothetical protein